MTHISTFPVDDSTLLAILHSMEGSYVVDEDGTHTLVGADYSFNQLLEFLSNYDPDAVVPIDGDPLHADVVEYVGPTLYHHTDVIRALVAEVRRLRTESENNETIRRLKAVDPDVLIIRAEAMAGFDFAPFGKREAVGRAVLRAIFDDVLP